MQTYQTWLQPSSKYLGKTYGRFHKYFWKFSRRSRPGRTGRVYSARLTRLLAVAILAFIGVEASFLPRRCGLVARVIFSGGAIGWLVVLGLFMGVSFLANRWAVSDTSTATNISASVFLSSPKRSFSFR